MSWRLGFNVGAAGLYVVWADQRTWFGVLAGLVVGFALVAVYDLTTGRLNYALRL